MFANLTGMHAVVILAIVFLLFGAAKLPALAKSVGQSVRILRKEVNEDARDAAQDAVALATVPATTTAEPVVAAVPTAQQEQRIS
ncbi:Sec-independent protein translocase protein TatA [Corynebacterium provencense]|uniref:Sec-independent protein translocase protein TatA n=1 Tax=Corynebacterium provencense TaxID=1737425 RepID=A0A2Z3YSD8_9CORY|nr:MULTISPECIES: twin-arginine translocase TatA/TatE family subunit [Corynebacterium]AWT27209.1 Sec-independent protein translocase protein TatA [Corynebacterium provencense]